MIRRIVAAIDGSKNAQRAVEAASDLAKVHDAKLHLVHVIGSGAVPPALARMAEVEHLTKASRSADVGNVANVFGNLAVAQTALDPPAAAREIHQALGERLLENVAELARKNGVRSPDTILGEGNPAQAILDAAKRVDADLIVLGTRGLSDLKGLLLGSVSHKVIQLSSCSCLVVK